MMPLSKELSSRQILSHLTEISQRQFPLAGHRQVPFNTVETLLCCGLFYLLDPHKYGGANIEKVPPIVDTREFFSSHARIDNEQNAEFRWLSAA